MPEYLYTKVQLLHILSKWNVAARPKEMIPRKGTITHVFFPGKALNYADITWTELIGVYGKRLYRIVMGRK